MDDRSYRRIAVDKEMHCEVDGVRDWGYVYDLFELGAMIELPCDNLRVGSHVRINFHDLITAAGVVVWKISENVGVQFDGPLCDAIVEHRGFSVSSLGFSELLPRDRFGQILSGSMVSAPTHSVTDSQSQTPNYLLRDARIQEDRRTQDRRDTTRRWEKRLEINAKAKLCVSMRDGVEGRLIDLSTSGCSFLDRLGRFKSGDEVWLRLDSLEPWRGVVRWTLNDRVGIEFARPFYPAVLNHLVELYRSVVVVLAA